MHIRGCLLHAVCGVKGQIYKNCVWAPSPCKPDTCDTPIKYLNSCPLHQCVAQCGCPVGEVIDKNKNECVLPEQCPGTLSIISNNFIYSLLKFMHFHVYY